MYTTSLLWEQSLDGFSKKYKLLFRISKQISMMSSSNFQVIAREKKKRRVKMSGMMKLQLSNRLLGKVCRGMGLNSRQSSAL